jgi:GNAT superfamily N-acetyltransferase
MLSIKKIEATDIGTLCNIAENTFRDSYFHLTDPFHFEDYCVEAFAHEKLLAELNNPNSLFYFAMMNDEPIGYIKLNFGPAQTELSNENAMEIERIYLLKAYQGKQYGKQLLQYTIQTAIDKQLQYIWLGVWQKNPKAIRFYESNGFKMSGIHTFNFGGEEHDDLMMKLEL